MEAAEGVAGGMHALRSQGEVHGGVDGHGNVWWGKTGLSRGGWGTQSAWLSPCAG